MDGITAGETGPAPSSWGTSRQRRLYWFVTGLFCAVFLVSALLTFVDPEGTREATARLGFPPFIGTYPLALAKLAGVAAILWRRSTTLITFAFAGFLYDLVLALTAHVYENDFPNGWLAVFGLVVWCGAYRLERRRSSLDAQV